MFDRTIPITPLDIHLGRHQITAPPHAHSLVNLPGLKRMAESNNGISTDTSSFDLHRHYRPRGTNNTTAPKNRNYTQNKSPE